MEIQPSASVADELQGTGKPNAICRQKKATRKPRPGLAHRAQGSQVTASLKTGESSQVICNAVPPCHHDQAACRGKCELLSFSPAANLQRPSLSNRTRCAQPLCGSAIAATCFGDSDAPRTDSHALLENHYFDSPTGENYLLLLLLTAGGATQQTKQHPEDPMRTPQSLQSKPTSTPTSKGGAQYKEALNRSYFSGRHASKIAKG